MCRLHIYDSPPAAPCVGSSIRCTAAKDGRESNMPSNSIGGSLQCNHLGTGYCSSDVPHVPVMGEDDWLYSIPD
jgi:hypothetical protein